MINSDRPKGTPKHVIDEWIAEHGITIIPERRGLMPYLVRAVSAELSARGQITFAQYRLLSPQHIKLERVLEIIAEETGYKYSKLAKGRGYKVRGRK